MRQTETLTEPMTGPREPETFIWDDVLTCWRGAYATHAAHICRACGVDITDEDFISSGLLMSLCPRDLARALQTVREMSV